MHRKSEIMNINYYEETDSLYVDLSSRSSVETQEVSSDVNLDYEAERRLVGIDIDHASQCSNLFFNEPTNR